MERFRVCDGRLIIKIREDLDHHLAESIRESIDAMIEKEGLNHIVFDFNGMKFMDSAGIGLIMGRYKKVYMLGGSVDIIGISPSIDRILRISGLYKIVNQPVRTGEED